MSKILNNLMFIIPVMVYYVVEALIVGIFITYIWKFIVAPHFGNLGYFQIVGLYWIVKMLTFDVFKLVTGLAAMNPTIIYDEKENNNESED